MDLATSPAEPREDTRWREGVTLALNCGQRKHAGVLCWLYVSTTDRPAGVKSYTRSVVRVLSATVHETIAVRLPPFQSTLPSQSSVHCYSWISGSPRRSPLSRICFSFLQIFPSFSPSPARSSPHLFMANLQGPI